MEGGDRGWPMGRAKLCALLIGLREEGRLVCRGGNWGLDGKSQSSSPV